jgi:DNA-binding MarR family transcriptional regulator
MPGLIDELDEVLLEVRHLFRTPDFRRLLLGSIPTDVGLSALRLLRAVERHAGGPSVRDVADTLGIDPSTASRLVDGTVRRGLLRRERSTEDARRSRLSLTPAGESVLVEANGVRRGLLARVTADWPEGDTRELTRLLRRLRDGFEHL